MEEELIEKILQPTNLTMACKEVVRNKGAGGVDGMKVSELESYLQNHRSELSEQIRNCTYHAQPIRGKEIPKGKGNQVYIYLRDKLKLPINREKSGIRRPVHFQILGFGFVPIYRKGVKGKYQLVVTRKRWKSFKAKLKDITRKTKPMSFDERIAKLKEIQRGWLNAFKYANIKVKLEALDGWIRNRLRYCI